jgi:hypothetical protein
MTETLQVPKRKRIYLRLTAIILAGLSAVAGISLTIQLHTSWPLLVALFLGFIAYGVWVKSSWTLEIRTDGIILAQNRKQIFIPWAKFGEFAVGHGIDRYKVEYTFSGERHLADAYRGRSKCNLRNPRFLPDTFGMTACNLADLLNRKKVESTQQSHPG